MSMSLSCIVESDYYRGRCEGVKDISWLCKFVDPRNKQLHLLLGQTRQETNTTLPGITCDTDNHCPTSVEGIKMKGVDVSLREPCGVSSIKSMWAVDAGARSRGHSLLRFQSQPLLVTVRVRHICLSNRGHVELPGVVRVSDYAQSFLIMADILVRLDSVDMGQNMLLRQKRLSSIEL